MKTSTQFGTCQKIIALAVLGTFGSAHASDDEIAKLTKPDSSISVGAAGVSGNQADRAIFGQYNGMRKSGGSLELDIDYLKREDSTGTWMSLQGRNLGRDNRDLSVGYQQQGDWKITGDYSELIHREIRTINTADTAVGTANPTVVRLATPGTGNDVNLQLKRVGLGMGVEKWLTPGLQFEASFKNEDKKGARLWGRGYDCAAYVCAAAAGQVKNAILMVAEPVNTTTRQFEAKFNFSDEKLNLSAAYYGSFFNSGNGSLNPIVPNTLNNGFGTAATLAPAVGAGVIPGGGTSLQNVLQSPMGLPPNNQAHQFSLTGNYAFTPTTKANFKYSYTHATQNQSFSTMGLSGGPVGVDNLGGILDTTLFQLGLTTKPTPKLSLLANIRYERKEDKTPQALYNVEPRQTAVGVYSITPPSTIASATWNNGLMPVVKLSAKVEGSYKLPQNFLVTAGVDLHNVDRAVPAALTEEVLAGLSPMRDKTSELGYRLELRRTMSETLTGALGYASSKRTGSDWTSLSQLLVPSANIGLTAAQIATNTALINAYCGGRSCYGQQMSDVNILGVMGQTTPFAMSMVNTDKEKWKASLNWTAMERLSFQFGIENGKEDNTSAQNGLIGSNGWRGTKSSLYNIDADYTVTDNWKLNGFWSRGDQHLKVNHSGYRADINNINNVFGFGLLGQLSGKLEVGANLNYQNDVNKYGINAAPTLSGNTATDVTGGTFVAPTANNLAQAAIGLPDVTFRQTTLSMFAKYGLDKSSDVRVNLAFQRSMLNEWAWGGNGLPSFTYADNTTVSMKQTQNVTFIGAAYIYKFQ